MTQPQRIPAGQPAIGGFLIRQWAIELDYRLIKELWAFSPERIAVRFAYEWHDAAFAGFRSYGNENWAFDALGLKAERHASINDLQVAASDRQFLWESAGARPADHPGLSVMGVYGTACAAMPPTVALNSAMMSATIVATGLTASIRPQTWPNNAMPPSMSPP